MPRAPRQKRRTPPRSPAPLLTAKQQRFVEEYLVDANATQAAIRAGYSARTASQLGYRLLALPYIASAIASATLARSQRTEVTLDYVVASANEVLLRCLQRAPVMVGSGRKVVQAVDEDGRHVWQFDARGANGALQILAKHTGLGGPNVNVNLDFEKLTVEQLEHLANGGSLANLPR